MDLKEFVWDLIDLAGGHLKTSSLLNKNALGLRFKPCGLVLWKLPKLIKKKCLSRQVL